MDGRIATKSPIYPPFPMDQGNSFSSELTGVLRQKLTSLGLSFIVMDGNGALFGTLSGNTRDVVQKFSVDLPKKHGRGGQSALRFARLREEKRHNYVRKGTLTGHFPTCGSTTPDAARQLCHEFWATAYQSIQRHEKYHRAARELPAVLCNGHTLG